MDVFKKIFQHEIDNYYLNKNIPSSMFNFEILFAPKIITTSIKKYGWLKFIRYKYFVLENFLKYPDKHFQNENIKKDILEIFFRVQKKIMSLYKFKNILLFKSKNYLTEQVDMSFSPLCELSDSYKIELVQNKVKYMFSLFDLIKIINSSLSYNYNFFTEPSAIKNPWNNKIFNDSCIYNIYYAILKTSIPMPILLLQFVKSNLCLKDFDAYNQLIIKNYIIENSHLFSEDKKIKYIRQLIYYFNDRSVNKITVDKNFPKKKLLLAMNEFIKPYLKAVYSYEADLRIRYRMIFFRKMKNFVSNNPMFGRRLISFQIRKLYYLSCLKYVENKLLFLSDSTYIPTPDMIMLKEKSFFIDFVNTNNYSMFPQFDSYKKNAKVVQKYDYKHISKNIKNYRFSQSELELIEEKYKNIIKEELNSISTTPTSSLIDTNSEDNDITNEYNYNSGDDESEEDEYDDDDDERTENENNNNNTTNNNTTNNNTTNNNTTNNNTTNNNTTNNNTNIITHRLPITYNIEPSVLSNNMETRIDISNNLQTRNSVDIGLENMINSFRLMNIDHGRLLYEYHNMYESDEIRNEHDEMREDNYGILNHLDIDHNRDNNITTGYESSSSMDIESESDNDN